MAKLADVLATEVCAVAESGAYTISVREDDEIDIGGPEDDEPMYVSGYSLAVAFAGMPPHFDKDFRTLDELLKETVFDQPIDSFNWFPCDE